MPKTTSQVKTAEAALSQEQAADTKEVLTATEKQQLIRDESELEHHFGTFRIAGEALRDIRDARLYRESHPTFDAYCREKWSMTRQQADRLINAARVAKQAEAFLPPRLVEHLTESAMRPLAFLDEKDANKVLKAVIKKLPERKKATKNSPAVDPGTSLTARLVTDTARTLVPDAFSKVKARGRKKGRKKKPEGDYIRRSEVLETIDAWEKKNHGKLIQFTAVDILTAVRKIISEV